MVSCKCTFPSIHSHCACMCLELSVGSPNPAIHSAGHVSLSPSVLFEPRRHHKLTTTTLWSAWLMAENTTESDRLPSSNFRPILGKQNPTKQATSPIVFYSFNAAASTNCALQWVRYCYFLSPPPYEKTGAAMRACRLPQKWLQIRTHILCDPSLPWWAINPSQVERSEI